MTNHSSKYSLCVLLVILFLTVTLFSFQEQFTTDDAPDELSLAHSESPGLKNCLKCHTEELEVSAEKCLTCHQSPHPGNQDVCISCHSQDNWRVDIWEQRESP